MTKYLLASTLLAAALSIPAFADGSGTQGDPYTGTCENLDLSGFEANTTVYIEDAEVNWATGSNYTFAADIDISTAESGGLTITSGSTDYTYTFSGKITGEGDWTFTDNVAQNYVFTGDLSGYAGAILYFASSVTGSLTFGDGNTTSVTGSVSGTGQMVFAGGVTYNYAKGESAVTIANSSGDDSYDMKVTNLTFSGTADYVVNVAYIEGFGGTNNSGHTNIGSTSGNHITISTTGSVTFAGVDNSMKLDYLGTFTVDQGSTLIIDSDCTMGFRYGNGSYGLFVNGTLQINAGKSLTVDDDTNGGGAATSIANLVLGDGSALNVKNSSTTTMSLGTVTVSGAAAIKVGQGSNDSQDDVTIGALAGTGTLTLDGHANSSAATLFELGSTTNTSSTSQFTGTIIISDSNDGSRRSVSLIISEENIAAGAVIEFGTESASDGSLSIGVNAERVEIAGLSDASTHNGGAVIYAGKDTGDLGTSGGSITSNSETTNTLAINVAENASYSFSGVVLDMLNIEKLGAGTQAIAFESSSSFDGSIAVKAGTLALSGADISSTGITVSSGATLNISNTITLAADSTSTISGTLSIGSGGQLDLTGTVTINSAIQNAGTITIADGTSITVGVTMQTGTYNDANYQYYELITGSGSGSVELGSSVTFVIDEESITLSSIIQRYADSDSWNIYSEGGSLYIYAETSTTAETADPLYWAGTEDNNTWSTNESNTPWSDSDGGSAGLYFADGANVIFGSSAAEVTTVTVSGEVVATTTTINGAYTFAIGDGASVTTGALTYGEGGSLALTGSGKIVTGAADNGTLIAFDASDFTGEMDFTQGHLDIGNSTFNEGATVVVTANTTASDDATGVLTTTDVSLSLANAENESNSEFAANLVLDGNGGVIIRSNAASKTVTFSGSVTGESATLQLNGGGNAVFTNTVNVGTYTNYQGTTTFSGATTLGELTIYQPGDTDNGVTFTGSAAQATVTDITIHSSVGSVAATLTVSDGASLSVGTMAIDHDLAITIDSAAMSITGTVTQAENTSTSVTISNGGTLSLGSDVSLNVAAMEIVLGTDTYTNGTYAITGDNSSSLTLTDDAAIKITVDSALASLLETDGTYTFDIYSGLSLSTDVFDIDDILNYSENVSWNNGVLTVIVGSGAIPEPSMFGFFFGLGAIGLVATRRRRKAA